MSSLTRRIQRAHGTREVVIDDETVTVGIRTRASTLPYFGTQLGYTNPKPKPKLPARGSRRKTKTRRFDSRKAA